jgi:ribosomal protein S14
MKYLILKDKKHRNLFKKKELKNVILKSFRQENFIFQKPWYNISKKYRIPNFVNYYKNREFFKNSGNKGKGGHFSTIRNRCILSGKGRSIYRKYHISRIVLRELASKGSLLGVRKVSW